MEVLLYEYLLLHDRSTAQRHLMDVKDPTLLCRGLYLKGHFRLIRATNWTNGGGQEAAWTLAHGVDALLGQTAEEDSSVLRCNWIRGATSGPNVNSSGGIKSEKRGTEQD
ncbi:Hypothetical protein SMAX5B_011603 [Scophthalmus maximus]|uniref:Uncharacterized protein n=1 Tax=Scophthalmus maximus TaxID=52904 RepID=A0A2U9BNU4_SCOMX|nr:Hypothetical protein SMAX5B_011603 [Scophthalmus maximus]